MGPKIIKRKSLSQERLEKKREEGRERNRRFRASLNANLNVSRRKKESASTPSPSTLPESSVSDPEMKKGLTEVKIKEECEDEDEISSQENPESELLPGPKGQQLFYDGVGFYYTQLYEDTKWRWLQCYHGDCKVISQMRLQERAPILPVEKSASHDHPPNPARRDRLLFLHTIKTRHANEDTPFSVIYQEEALKNPVGASFFSIDKIQAHLQKKISLGGSGNLSQESVLSAASQLSEITMVQPPADEEPALKKMKVDNKPPKKEKLSKKLERLKTLTDVSITESVTKEPGTRRSERVAGLHPHSYLYHDGYGMFYKPLSISGNTRYLHCNTQGCPAQAVMALEENSPIIVEKDSPPHNHSHPGMPSASVVLNKSPSTTRSVKKLFEKLEGPEYYYDFKGHYYFSARTENNKRFLRCLYPTCLAQAMLSDDDAEIQPVHGSRPHNHQPDLATNYKDKIKQWEDQWRVAESLPSERLPSLRVQYCCYHDGRGFYYHQTSQSDNIRLLACVEPKCAVKACMNTQKDAPITISGLRMGHSHGPDYTLRDALLFVDAVRVRARSDTPITSAIALEAARNPVGAERVNLQLLKSCLEQAAKILNSKLKDDTVEDEVDFVSCLKTGKAATLKPSTWSQVPVSNHFNFPAQILDDYEEKDGQHTKAQMVPALLSDSWLYHDGRGYYYNTRSIDNGFRYLQCALPRCRVQAVVAEEGGPVKLQKPHSHGPQPAHHQVELWFFHRIKVQAQKNPNLPIAQIYREVANKDPAGAILVSQTEVIQLMHKFLISALKSNLGENIKNQLPEHEAVAEVLPTSTGDCLYHDGQGYYYSPVDLGGKRNFSTNLKCSYRTTCPAKANLVDGKVVINKTSRHNHKPDTIHRDICLFSQALKRRTRDEDTPLSVIYKEESTRYPKAAAVLLEDQLKPKLISIRKYIWKEVNGQDEEVEEVDGFHNSTNQTRQPNIASEKFPGKTKDVYHDGRGYYYHETFTDNQIRYLMCCEPHCLAQAKMGLAEGAPVVGQVGAARHCHAPDPLRRRCLQLVCNIRQRAGQHSLRKIEKLFIEESAKEPLVAAQIPKLYLYSIVKSVRFPENEITVQSAQTGNAVAEEDDELWLFSEACERLPSEHGWLYIDLRGYLYYSHDTDKTCMRRRLKCCEEGCDATARLGDSGWLTRAPGSVLHNHTPPPRRRSVLMLLHRVSVRAQVEHTSVTDIYNEEAQRDPESAALIPRNKLNETLQILTVRRYFKNIEEEELDQKEDTSEEKLTNDEVSVQHCETLPSASSDKEVYHDSAGHYFVELSRTPNKQYVKCLMPLCGARGFVLVDEPTKLHIPKSWAVHNHKPDLFYRSKLLFISSLRKRTLNENSSVDDIYEEESEREPVGADQVDDTYIKNVMHKLRKLKSVGDDTEMYPFEEFTEHSAASVTEKATEQLLAVGNKNSCKQVPKEKVPNTNQARVQVSKKMTISSIEEDDDDDDDDDDDEDDDDDGEYSEDYLEEEMLEEPEGDLIATRDEYGSTSKSDEELHPTEKLFTRTNNLVYYNGQGYYFQINSTKGNHLMYLKCTEPGCKARGIKLVDPEDSPITSTRQAHNHPPDFKRRDLLVFIHKCKVRATKETQLTVKQILDQELARDSKMAQEIRSRSDIKNIKTQMKRYRVAFASGVETHLAGETSNEIPGADIRFHEDSNCDTPKEIEIHQGTVPEKVPSLAGDTLWHADGYLYSPYSVTRTLEKVKCVEKDCEAQAEVTLGDRGQQPSITMIAGPTHNHAVDLQRRDQLVFIDRCKRRAATTLQSVEEIYYDEAAKEPEVAAQLSAVRVKRAMAVAKKEKLKKGIRLEPKEGEQAGDHGMSELGEMAKMPHTSTPSVAEYKEEAESDDGASEHSYAEDSADDLWAAESSNSSGEKLERKRRLGRERQRRKKNRISEDYKFEQQEKKTKATESEPKSSPMLGPKFVKQLVEPVCEEELYEEEETLEDTYSDYVTLEEDLEYNDLEQDKAEQGVEEEEGGREGSSVIESAEQGSRKIEERNTTSSHLVHGRNVNNYWYHDGKGFFYTTINSLTRSDEYRLLKCVTVGCLAKGRMSLGDDNAPITLMPRSPAHSHLPAPRHKRLVQFIRECEARALNEHTPLQEIYDDVAEKDPLSANKLVMEDLLRRMTKIRVESLEDGNQSADLNLLATGNPSIEEYLLENEEVNKPSTRKKESELLPGYRPNATIYHDLKGFYYIFNALRDKKRYVKCIETKCRVRGVMQIYQGAPIRTTPHAVHNHRPDLQRKDILLFLNRCKERAMIEDLPLLTIYREECAKDPKSATKISSHNLLQRMQRARKLTQTPTDQDQMEFAEACFSNMTDIPPHEPVEDQEENSQSPEESDVHLSETALTEEAPEEGPVPSETLPGGRPNSTTYHDGRGYYYRFNHQGENFWYLTCVEPQCRVRARMKPVDGSPITHTSNTRHSHRPDYRRKRFSLWMERAKQRAVSELHKPIPTIVAEETARDMVSAGMIRPKNFKKRLYRARNASLNTELGMMGTDEDYGEEENIEAAEETETDESQDYNNVYVQQSNEAAQRPTYVDEKGFCYQQTTLRGDTRYLKCVEAGCKARASMGLQEDSTITLNKHGSQHNHAGDQSQLAMLEMSESQGEPVQVIYTDENGGEQIAVCHFMDEAVDRPKRPYKQRTQLPLTIDPEETPSCLVDVAAGDYYHNEEQQKYPIKPSEVIPGLRPDANNYHDGNGFYYELNRLSPNIRYLKCLIKDCKARAYMELSKENAPIIQTNFSSHNHGPDLSRKQFTVFLHRVTRRAAEEDTPLNVIYQQEADRDPTSASQIRMENVKQRMMRARKKHRQNQTKNHEESTAAETDLDGSIYHFFIEDEKAKPHQDEEEGEENEEEVTEREEEEAREGEEEEEGIEEYQSYVVNEVEVEFQQQHS